VFGVFPSVKPRMLNFGSDGSLVGNMRSLSAQILTRSSIAWRHFSLYSPSATSRLITP
jgi:hypothetical protein